MWDYWPHATIAVVMDILVVLIFIPWVLRTKRDPTVAVSWCLLVLFLPLVGAALFWVFGYDHIFRPLHRRLRHRLHFRTTHPPRRHEAARGEDREKHPHATWSDLGKLALTVNAFPVSAGNRVVLFPDTQQAFDNLLAAIRAASRHVHLEFFIVRGDATGKQLLDLLTEKAKQGVEVRLLYDSMGGWRLRAGVFHDLLAAGGKVATFLPINPLRSHMQVNMRNHRKIAVVDGQIAFTGGMNIGDEYLGKSPSMGYWRDEFLRLEGPAVAGLQRIFVEDWDFSCQEALNGEAYFPDLADVGQSLVQIAESGPDQVVNSIREIYFAAILSAQERVWIASPYFVPDSAMLEALRLACYRGVDVRLLTLLKPDHFISFYAGRYYWTDMLQVKAKIYQYRKGMMHSKLMMVDGKWGMVGSANLDNRSLHLNFEAGCMLHSPDLVAELERHFENDLRDADLLAAATFARRSYVTQLTENACRLFSPIL